MTRTTSETVGPYVRSGDTREPARSRAKKELRRKSKDELDAFFARYPLLRRDKEGSE